MRNIGAGLQRRARPHRPPRPRTPDASPFRQSVEVTASSDWFPVRVRLGPRRHPTLRAPVARQRSLPTPGTGLEGHERGISRAAANHQQALRPHPRREALRPHPRPRHFGLTPDTGTLPHLPSPHKVLASPLLEALNACPSHATMSSRAISEADCRSTRSGRTRQASFGTLAL